MKLHILGSGVGVALTTGVFWLASLVGKVRNAPLGLVESLVLEVVANGMARILPGAATHWLSTEAGMLGRRIYGCRSAGGF